MTWWYDIVSKLELLQIYNMHIETKTIQLSQSLFWFVLGKFERWDLHNNDLIFLCSKTKTVIWQARKKQKNFNYCPLRNRYIAKNKHTLFMRLFFRHELETDVNNVMKKKSKYSMSLKSCYSRQWLFSIRFSDQALFSLCAGTRANALNNTTTGMLTKAHLLPRWQKTSEK